VNPLFYSAHTLILIKRSVVVQHIMEAIGRNGRSLLLTALLGIAPAPPSGMPPSPPEAGSLTDTPLHRIWTRTRTRIRVWRRRTERGRPPSSYTSSPPSVTSSSPPTSPVPPSLFPCCRRRLVVPPLPPPSDTRRARGPHRQMRRCHHSFGARPPRGHSPTHASSVVADRSHSPPRGLCLRSWRNRLQGSANVDRWAPS